MKRTGTPKANLNSTVQPRSLQEWMERTQTRGDRLIELVWKRTGRRISPTMLSFVLRGSRRCSVMNALALQEVTGVPTAIIREWPKVSHLDQVSGSQPSHVA